MYFQFKNIPRINTNQSFSGIFKFLLLSNLFYIFIHLHENKIIRVYLKLFPSEKKK